MLRGFDGADFKQLAEQWCRFYPAKWAVNADQIRFNTEGSSVFDWGASQIYDGGKDFGFAIVKKSANPSLFKGPDPDQSHLSAIAFTDPQVGLDLLASVKRILKSRGCIKLVYGQDSQHFFPGVPVDFPVLRDFLTVEGFTFSGDYFDLERDISTYEPKAGTLEKLTGGVSVVPITAETANALDAFLKREFPGRWNHDVMAKIKLEGRSEFVYGLFVDGSIEGFAFTQDYTHKYPVCGGVWNVPMGEKWGALGPIGISAAIRGKGLGDALLAAALDGLKKRGAHNMIIDWTTLDRYYGGHGFQINRRYNAAELVL